MVADSRLLLRAEVHHEGGVFVTHTLEITDRMLTIACTELLRQDVPVRIRLSFPKLVDVFEVEGRVASFQPDDGPGREARVTVEIVSFDAAVRASLAALIGAGGRCARAGLPGSAYRCLLVEDSQVLRDLFAHGIDRYCHDGRTDVILDVAEDAEKARQMLDDHRYELAIIDHFLPRQSGAELISNIRADASLAGMVVVAMSVGGAEVRDAAMRAGADLFLDKPVVMRDLFVTIDRLTRASDER